MLDRDCLVDLDGGMQRAGQRRILDDRDRMLAGDLPDLQGQRFDAFGDADRRLHAALIFQRDGVVGRVGDDDRGLRHRRHHAPAHARLAHLLHLALDGRVAFGLLEFLLQFPQRHFLPLVPLAVLEQIIGSATTAIMATTAPSNFSASDLGERHDRRRIACARAP